MKNLAIIILTLMPLLMACSSNEEVKKEATTQSVNTVSFNADQIKNASIKEGVPSKEFIGMTLYANGTIEVPPQNKTIISVQFGGFIKSLNVLDGSPVKKGQTLFTIEHPELIQLQQDYLEVIGNIEYLESELERQKTLVQQEAGSVKSLQLARSQYNMAIAKRSGLKAKLDMAGVNMKQLNSGNLQRTISVTSPFDGVVTKVAVNVGAYAEPTEHLLEIIDLKHSHAEVIVFEKDVKYLKIGQPVKLNFGGGDQSLDASIFLIGKEIGKDRTVKVHCHLNQENKDIAPGSYFKASIFTGEQERFCVPSESVVQLNGRSVVFVVRGKKDGLTNFGPEEVTVLANDRDLTAIEFKNKSIKMTDPIVISGAYDIMSAILVKGEE